MHSSENSVNNNVNNNVSAPGRKSEQTKIKIISLGNAGVGKSCMIKRFCEKRFVPKYMATIGIDFGVTKVTCRGRSLKVNIFDMAGHPSFYEIRNEFYLDTQGVLLIYDVSDKASFDDLDSWLEEMRRELGSNCSQMKDIVFVVCANKIDGSRREVDSTDGRLWADSKGFQYFEVSALSGEGITAAFEALFEDVSAVLDNNGRRPHRNPAALGYSKEQVDAIQRLKNAKDDYQRLGLSSTTATSDEINKAFRRLSVLLHPDKSVAPGSEEAFKLVVAARTNLLRLITR